MATAALTVSDLWKRYSVGVGRAQTGTFYDLISDSLKSPFKRLRQLGGQSRESEEFWALQGLDFEVQPGEVLGIVGRNGAGKSTLLKILSRITAPTRGRVAVHGRMASLLEVGTGFHPELSGRENIFLNGAIMGMKRREVLRRFDEIVEFAEVGDFVDTPVKRYSSGMYVRLAFAVAAHLETDVLLVDEVLAVGDAAFQRKSLGKMGDVARGGKTVLFVSHNLAAMRNLCSRALVLERGKIAFDGPVGQGLTHYERSFGGPGGMVADAHFQGPLAEQIRFDRLACLQDGVEVNVIDPLRDHQIEVHGHADASFPNFELKISVFRDGFHIGSCHDSSTESLMRKGPFVSRFSIPGGVFRPGRYSIGLGASAGVGAWVWGPDVAILDYSETRQAGSEDRSAGLIAIPYSASRVQ